MTIIDKVKEYYQTNSSNLNSFLGSTTFLDCDSKYPNSVVIKFESNKLEGEISVWQNDNGSYLESEYFDLTEPDKEMLFTYEPINIDTVVTELTKQFEAFRKLCGGYNP